MDLNAHRKLIAWTVAILVVLNLGSLGLLWFAHANRPRSLQSPTRPAPAEFLIRDVGLNPEQAEKFRELREKHLIYAQSQREEIHALNRRILEELFRPDPDSALVRRLSEEIGHKQELFQEALYRHFEEVKQLCTPEQQEKLKRVVLEAMEVDQRQGPPPGRPEGPPPARIGDQ